MNKLIFGDIEVSEKEFYEGEKAVNLSEVDVSNKIKGNNAVSKVIIVYMNDISGIVIPLCIILPQMSGWNKIF